MSTRTITLTDRPPVTINEEAWPLIATATAKDWDNTHECQANRLAKVGLYVRQHSDGRAIVYATYTYTSQYQGENGVSARHGELLPAGSDMNAICRAIKNVASRMPEAQMIEQDWQSLADECIADLPAEELT